MGELLVFATHFCHEDDCVERDEGHDEVLERVRHHDCPDAETRRIFVLGHVPTQRLGIDCKINTLFL